MTHLKNETIKLSYEYRLLVASCSVTFGDIKNKISKILFKSKYKRDTELAFTFACLFSIVMALQKA